MADPLSLDTLLNECNLDIFSKLLCNDIVKDGTELRFLLYYESFNYEIEHCNDDLSTEEQEDIRETYEEYLTQLCGTDC